MKSTRRLKLFFCVFVFLFGQFFNNIGYTQPSYLHLHYTSTYSFENILNKKEISFHTSIKPYLSTEVRQYVNIDSIYQQQTLLLKKYFLQQKEGNIRIRAYPLFALQPGIEFSDSLHKNVLASSLGASINGNITQKLFFSLNVISGNSSYPEYLDNYISSKNIVNGKGYAFRTQSGYHYKNNTGYITYSPSTTFNFQLGHGKNFFGDGYRSLLLSDIANNYSFFKISTKIWKIKYINLYTNFKDIRNSDGYPQHFKNKYGTFHYLSWNATRWLNVGLFESVIWQGKDTLSNRGYDVNYLNPVIFFRPVEYANGSSDNSLIGLSLKVKIAKKQMLYGQVILDEFLLHEVKSGNGWWANKQGIQVGFKSFDIFKIPYLNIQTEMNYVRPYTYSHGSTLQNYAHFNEALAHPLGANFQEGLAIVNYQIKRLFIEGKAIYSIYGSDSANINFGQNIYASYNNRWTDYNNRTTQGVKTKFFYSTINLSYLLEPQSNLRIEAGYIFRKLSSTLTNNSTNFIYFGIRTSIANSYMDI